MTIEEAIAFHRAGRFAEAERAYRALLAANPADADALHFYGVLRGQRGDLKGALDLLARSLEIDPDAPQSHFHFANALAGAGRQAEALSHFERALALQPGYGQALLGRIGTLIDLGRPSEALELCRQLPANPQVADLRGRALMALKSYSEALAAFDAALALKGDFLDAQYHRADALHALGRNQEALPALARVLALKPDFAEAHLAQGNVLVAMGQTDQALRSFDRALALNPDLADAHLDRGRALMEMKRFGEALAAFDRAAALGPDQADGHVGRGGALLKLGRAEEALAAFERALALQPDSASVLVDRAAALVELDRVDEALDAFARALAHDPNSGTAYYNLGNTLAEVARYDEALAALDSAVALKPDWAEAHYNRADVLERLGRKDESLVACERALAVDPKLGLAFTKRVALRAAQCDWHNRAADVGVLKALCGDGALVDPFPTLAAFDDPLLQLKAARALSGPARLHAWVTPVQPHQRLRIAYMSPDFRDHPVAHQLVELLERHDRSRFEIFGICLQAEADSPVRTRLRAAFEHFDEAGSRTDAGIAKLIADHAIDIVVDLAGYTDKGRTRALSYRPAPIAVNFLGYSGSLGADYVDYIIADSVVAPPGHESFYSEKIVRLPHCFFPSDSQGRGQPAPRRAEEGLPENGFVFCTFNNAYKITPELFDIWMRLLQAVAGSVLWLRIEKPAARDNLRREAERRGVPADQLIFAERAPRERHLARIALADLFLDSTPYNAHTTCNDALWAGLPLVTCPGQSFASRVAASMLTVVGAPELIVSDLAAYESLALELARSPQRLAMLRQRLVSSRAANPLFDMARLSRSLESAYEIMAERHRGGQKPCAFSVNVEAAQGASRR